MKKFKNSKGFSLVELMIVVAIIGILSAVAIPNFKKYQAKSKTSEAKLQLAGMYTALSSYLSNNDTYDTCLNVMGYEAYAGTDTTFNYYSVGFNSATASLSSNTLCDTNGNDEGLSYWSGTKGSANSPTDRTAAEIPTDLDGDPTIETLKFTVGAVGNIANETSANPKIDSWSMNETKDIEHVTLGY